MSSHARSSREEERRLSVRTLVIASAASALAAIVTSQFWIDGTPIAAALTPVIVTLVSELLHRPTEKIAQRFTAETPATRRRAAPGTPETDALPEAAGAGPPPRREEYDPRPAREPAPRGLAGGEPEFRVYRTSHHTRRIPWKPILVTATIAFVVGMAALTLPELLAGQSLGSGDRKTTLFGGGDGDRRKEPPAEEQTEPGATIPDPNTAEPDQTTPDAPPPPQQTAPVVPDTPAPTPPTPVPQVPPQQ